MNDKEMLYIKQNGECYINKDCKWRNNDKEKQIEKITKIIEEVKLYGNDNYERKISYDSGLTLAKEIYDKLFPKDSIVLTRKELEKMVNAKMKCINDMAVISREETAKELLTAQLKECIEAEKRILKIRKNRDDLYYNGFSLAITNLKMYIKELAKQYNVEIGE